jgi:hypothetical protein
LGQGDFIAGTNHLLSCLKAGSRAAAVAEMARQQGVVPAGRSVVVRTAGAEREADDQQVNYDDLLAQSRQLEPLAPICYGCRGNILNRPFGCCGLINYPISRTVEEWLAARLQPSSAVGGKLFLAAIRDFGYTGQPIQPFRAAGLFEAAQPVKKRLKRGWFASETVTTDQLFQAMLCVGTSLDPAHCFGVLLWLGCLQLEGAVIESSEQVAAVNQLREVTQRRQRTAFVTGAEPALEGVAAFERFLQAMCRAWLLEVPLWVSA